MIKNLSFVFSALLLFGCATPQLRAVKAARDLPHQALIADVPFIAQTKNHCGPAAMAMMLRWSAKAGRLNEAPATSEDLAAQVFTPGREGSLQTDMLAAGRRHGRLVVPIRDLHLLLSEMAVGNPVLVLQNLGLSWHPQWHYAVATGYDLPRELLFFHSGTEERLELPMDTFEHTWERGDRWALLVLPPGKLPAAAPEADVTAAAVAMEPYVTPIVAATAYRRILSRWPKNLEARIGFANSKYALKDLKGAVAQLQMAVKYHPEAAPAWHNLAIALAEDHRIKTAGEAADKALARSEGEQREQYKKSFAEAGIRFSSTF